MAGTQQKYKESTLYRWRVHNKSTTKGHYIINVFTSCGCIKVELTGVLNLNICCGARKAAVSVPQDILRILGFTRNPFKPSSPQTLRSRLIIQSHFAHLHRAGNFLISGKIETTSTTKCTLKKNII